MCDKSYLLNPDTQAKIDPEKPNTSPPPPEAINFIFLAE